MDSNTTTSYGPILDRHASITNTLNHRPCPRSSIRAPSEVGVRHPSSATAYVFFNVVAVHGGIMRAFGCDRFAILAMFALGRSQNGGITGLPEREDITAQP